jgi:hypothetical protein
MKTIIQIIKKDLRLHGLLLCLWIIAWAGSLVLPLLVLSSGDESYEDWGRSVVYGGGMLLMLQELLIAAFLCVRVVQEDPLTSSTSLWRTLPISGWRLLSAKLLLLWTLLAVVPVLANVCMALVYGAGAGQTALSSVQLLALRTVCILFAGAIGASTRGMRGIIAICLIVLLGIPLLCEVCERLFVQATLTASAGQMASINVAFLACSLLLASSILLGQYLRPARRHTAQLLFAGTLVIVSLPAWWRWDFVDGNKEVSVFQGLSPTASIDAGTEMTFRVSKFAREQARTAQVSIAPIPEHLVAVPLYNCSPHAAVPDFSLSLFQLGKLRDPLPYNIANRLNLLGLIAPHRLAPESFKTALGVGQLFGTEAPHKLTVLLSVGPTDTTAPGSLFTEIRRFTIANETPLFPGASLCNNDTRMTLGRLEFAEENVRIAYRQVSWVSLFSPEGAMANSFMQGAMPFRLRPFFGRHLNELVLINRKRGEALIVSNRGQDRMIQINSLTLSHGRLKIPRTIGTLTIDEAWLKDASLAFLDFQRVARLSCPLVAK